MYDRALEMSRAAAINELTGEDLANCEITYVTAIRMLEAVLEDDGMRSMPGSNIERQSGSQPGDKVILDELQVEDRQVVVKRESYQYPTTELIPNSHIHPVVSSMRGRLASVRKKVAVLSKRSSVPTPTVSSAGKAPTSTISPVAYSTGVTPPR